MTMPGPGLTRVALADLETLLAAVADGRLACPITRAGLGALGLGHLADETAVLSGLGAPAVVAVVCCTLAERRPSAGPGADAASTRP